MAGTVTFILKDPSAKSETPINLVFWYKQLRIKISTGKKIKPKQWNPETHKTRESKYRPENTNINNRLGSIEKDVLSAFADFQTTNETISPEQLTKVFKDIISPPVVNDPVKMTFFKSVDQYVKTVNRSPRTKLSYGTTVNVLKEYSATLKKELDFDNINMDFYEDFKRYCFEGMGFALNTFGDHIKKVKVFMNYANDKGYTTNQGHKHRKFQTVEETAESIYLNDEELKTLYEKDLSDKKKLDRVRDLFIIGCYTGLRFSDLSQLTPDKFIKDGEQLKIKTVKTGETVIIPLHWTIKEILNKYDGGLPRVLSNQKMNEYLKELGEEAEINEKITITKTKGNLSTDKTLEKYNLMTVHTARRSFATNMFLAGVPTISIMKITGHRTERAFMKYIKITAEQNADNLQSHPFFAPPLRIAQNDN
jgi:integrase